MSLRVLAARALVLLASAALASCGRSPEAQAPPSAPLLATTSSAGVPVVAAPQEPAESEPAPIEPSTPADQGPFVDLPVPGHRDAVVSVPARAAGSRPLLVATHGAGGTPEAHCTFWRRLLGDRAFVLCPRGASLNAHVAPEDAAYFYDGHPRLAREVEAALDALTARFGDRVDARAAVYAGFSQGATMGALALPLLPGRFARAVLIEGGDADWSRYTARVFATHGGARALFLCGRPACAANARRSAGYLEREGVPARAIHAVGAGHTYGGKVEQELVGALGWLLEGDPRWQAGAP
jgi:predicted esterase